MPERPSFTFHRDRHSDKPMACRVYAGEQAIGFIWRAWAHEARPSWVTRLTADGPDLSIEPTKTAAAMVLWRIAGVRAEQSRPEAKASSTEELAGVPA